MTRPQSIFYFGTFYLFCAMLCFAPRTAAQPALPCGETRGRVTEYTYTSTLTEQELAYNVYLPPCYAATTAVFPALYLMHGSNSDHRLWVTLGLPEALNAGIAAGTLPPMIVILPDGGGMANENRFDRLSWENVFLTELLPHIEANFRVMTGREGRAIGGISRGGFWAFHIALRQPGLFSAVGGHSAFFDPSNAPPAFNPLNLAAEAPGIDRLRIWLDRGRDDYAQYGFDLMHAALTQRGIAHEYVVYPSGEHNNAYWSAHVAEYLAFYAAEWANVITPETLLPPTATPDASVPTLLEQAAQRVFVPVVAFPAPRSSITLDRLRRVSAGEVDPDLIVDSATAEVMEAAGFTLNRFTRIVPPDALLSALWQAASAERPAWGLLGWEALSPHYRVLHVSQPDGTAAHPLTLRGYPLAAPGEPANFDPARLTRLTFSGVTALARNTLAALDTNGVAWAAEAILPYVQQADYFHISNEVSFAPRCPQSDQPVLGGLCSKDAHFDLFTLLGVDIVELTGNHNNDYGFEVYRRTLGLYADAGMQTVGGGETIADARAPLILDHNGTRIGLFACNFNGPEFALASDALGAERPGAAFCVIDGWLREAIPALKESVDVVVVLVQYAEYDRYRPIERQMFHFRALADAGADMVLGSQAHRPQTFELYETPSGATAFLHYGLGNLFFDQPELENRQFFMDTAYFYDGRLLTVDLFTGVIEDLARPRPMTPDEQASFLRMMLIEYGDLLAATDGS